MRSSSLRTPYGHDRVELPGEVQRVAVRQVPAVREVHAEDGVARLQHDRYTRHVGLRAGVRLHVRVLGPEQRLRPLDGQRLGDVDELAAAVVALARISLRVLVGHHRARGVHDGHTREVLGGDQLEAEVLPRGFVGDRVGDVWVDLGQRAQVLGVGDTSCQNLRLRAALVLERPVILSMRLWWRPPAKGVSRNVDTICSAMSERRHPRAEREDIGVVVFA